MSVNDTELLDWFENQGSISGAALINDDNGHWAVSAMGMQNVVCGEDPQDVETTFIVEAAQWKKTIREAILAFKAECEEYEAEESP